MNKVLVIMKMSNLQEIKIIAIIIIIIIIKKDNRKFMLKIISIRIITMNIRRKIITIIIIIKNQKIEIKIRIKNIQEMMMLIEEMIMIGMIKSKEIMIRKR